MWEHPIRYLFCAPIIIMNVCWREYSSRRNYAVRIKKYWAVRVVSVPISWFPKIDNDTTPHTLFSMIESFLPFFFLFESESTLALVQFSASHQPMMIKSESCTLFMWFFMTNFHLFIFKIEGWRKNLACVRKRDYRGGGYKSKQQHKKDTCNWHEDVLS